MDYEVINDQRTCHKPTPPLPHTPTTHLPTRPHRRELPENSHPSNRKPNKRISLVTGLWGFCKSTKPASITGVWCLGLTVKGCVVVPIHAEPTRGGPGGSRQTEHAGREVRLQERAHSAQVHLRQAQARVFGAPPMTWRSFDETSAWTANRLRDATRLHNILRTRCPSLGLAQLVMDFVGDCPCGGTAQENIVRKVAIMCVANGGRLVTGKPGTGKTTPFARAHPRLEGHGPGQQYRLRSPRARGRPPHACPAANFGARAPRQQNKVPGQSRMLHR